MIFWQLYQNDVKYVNVMHYEEKITIENDQIMFTGGL